MRGAVLVAIVVVAACGPPESYYRSGAAGTGGGAAGVTGTAGVVGNGVAGTTGAAGVFGVAGTTGSAGTKGVAGTTGAAGTTGVAGTTGSAGTTGAAGTPGSAGTTGVAGTTGAAGTTGVAGTTGAAGTTGSGVKGSCLPAQWTGSASGVNGAEVPKNAFDGNITTRWGTAAPQKPGQYFQIDFGGTVQLTQVVLDSTTHAGDYPRGYDVGLSADGTTFNSVAKGTPAAATVVTIDFAAAQGRFLRITMTGTDGLWWSIDEIRLACTVP